jgi:hypothetical protein
MIAEINETAEYALRPVSQVIREAIHRGLLDFRGHGASPGGYVRRAVDNPSHTPRGRHDAEIHEAGHAAAVFLWGAPSLGVEPYEAVIEVALKPKGAGHVRHNAYRCRSNGDCCRRGCAGEIREGNLR